MATAKLTKKTVEAAELPPKGQYEIWDTQMKGLGLVVGATGRKTFIFRFTGLNKKKQKLKIGVFGNITCEIAREIAQRWAGDLARGINPQEEKIKQQEKQKRQITFADFFKIYTERHMKPHYKKTTFKSSSSWAKSYLLPFFGKNLLGEITTKDILSFKSSLKNKTVTYNRCFGLISKVFRTAEGWDYVEKDTDPCRGVSKYPETKRELFLTAQQLTLLETELSKRQQTGRISPYLVAAIRLIMYTGCRLREILDLKWVDVHLDEKYLLLKDSKTGERIVPLNESALNILKGIEKKIDNPHVACGAKRGQSLASPFGTWDSIRKEIGIPKLRLHDLRHSFASFAIKQGLDIFLIAKLLGHKQVQTTMRYAHIGKDDLIKASNVVGKSFQ